MLQNPEPYRIHHPPLDPHVSDPVTMAATDSITNHDEDMSEVDAVMKQQGFSTPSGELGQLMKPFAGQVRVVSDFMLTNFTTDRNI